MTGIPEHCDAPIHLHQYLHHKVKRITRRPIPCSNHKLQLGYVPLKGETDITNKTETKSIIIAILVNALPSTLPPGTSFSLHPITSSTLDHLYH
eukprot:gene5179-7023_t